MAISLRSCKIISAIQVISNLNRTHIGLLWLQSGIPESRFGFAGLSLKSVFLTDFSCKRNLGSIPSIKVIDEHQLVENQTEMIADLSNWQLVICKKLDLNNPKATYFYEVANKHKNYINQGNCSTAVYFNNGHSHSFMLNKMSDLMVSDYEKQMILLSESTKEPSSELPKKDNGKPSPDQLQYVLQILSKTLPKLFTHPLDYSIYHENLIFENHIRGTKTVGLYHYVKQVALLRIIGHMKFAYVTFDILKITSHPEDGSVKVRWRIRGVSGLKVFLNFWKFRILQIKETLDRESESWYDGFSIFYIDSGGKVYKHIVDKMQPDPEEKLEPIKPNLAAKLALMLGLTPRDCLDLSNLISAINESSKCLSDAMLPLDKIE